MTTEPQADSVAGTGGEPPPPASLESEIVPTQRYVRLSDLSLTYKFWENPRTITGLDDTSLRDLAASISRLTTVQLPDEDASEEVTIAGIREPLKVVMIRANGSVVNLVIDGQRRERAMRLVFQAPVDPLVPVLDLEPVPVEWTQALANKYLFDALDTVATREGLSSFEFSECAEKLRKARDPDTAKDYTLEKIAAALGKSTSWVSRILKARSLASPMLLHTWQIGEITDEQFKDLADQRDPERQQTATDAVVEARRTGDKASSRVIAKEVKEQGKAEAKAAKAAAEPTGSKRKALQPSRAPVVHHGEIDRTRSGAAQDDLPAVAAPPPRKPPPFAVVEDLIGMAKKRPPTHDYVKGLMHGAAWASGVMDAAGFSKPWHVYSSRVAGSQVKPSTKAPPKKKERMAVRRLKKR